MNDAGQPSLAGGLLIPPIIPEIDKNIEIDTKGLSLLTEVLLDSPSQVQVTDATTLLPAFDQSISQVIPSLEILDIRPQIGEEPPEKDDSEPNEAVAPEQEAADNTEQDQEPPTEPMEVPPELQAEAKPGDIAAYFALEFLDMQYIYYLQRSSVSLGRGGIDATADIDLGPLKNISRLHARIEYEEELERFVLVVIGRNGVFVDGIWIEPGRRVPLGDRTLVQISSRTFYFLLPTQAQGQSSNSNEGDNEQDAVPSLDSTVTTAEDEDEEEEEDELEDEVGSTDQSRSPSVTPKQGDIGHPESPITWSIGGKGKGKSILAMGPPKRKRGRPPKSASKQPIVTYSNPRIETSPKRTRAAPHYDDEAVDTPMLDPTTDHDLDLGESEEDEDDYGDDGGEFIPRGGRGKRMGGLGKTKPSKIKQPVAFVPMSVKEERDEDMSNEEFDGDGDADNEDGTSAKRPSKRKRETNEVDGDADESARALKKKRIVKAKSEVDPSKKSDSKPKGGRKKSGANLPMKSLFTTTALNLERGEHGGNLNSTTGEGSADPKGKLKAGKKGKEKKEKGKAKDIKKEPNGDNDNKGGGDLEDGDKASGDKDSDKEEKAPSPPPGPPPQKPPFTYPLLCYRALKALNGKASYRAITKWLETEYPYFAMASKEGKDGWENSTRHTLSSHRAFLKIDRKPEERGKGCFWSFDPEFEIQFADQWQAALSNSRNPRVTAPRPPPTTAGPSNGPHPPGAPLRPPYPPYPWSGVTPPHLMPGYRPMPPGTNGPSGPFTFPPSLGRPPHPGMPPHPPNGMHPPHPPLFPNGHPPHGPFQSPPHPNSSAVPPPKARAPKKPKQALGAAFSRAPLIRPGLGGIPANGNNANPAGGSNGPKPPSGKEMDGIRIHGERLAAMAARIAKDEMSGRAPPGTALNAALGCLPPPPPPSAFANGVRPPYPMLPPRPAAGAKLPFVLAPPPDAIPPSIPQGPPGSASKSLPIPSSSGKKEDDSESIANEKKLQEFADTAEALSPATPSTSTTAPTSPTPSTTLIPGPPSVPASSPPPRPPMPMSLHKGTLYLHPRAFPHLTPEDLKKMNELNVGDAMTYLMGRNVVLGAPPPNANPHSNAGGNGNPAPFSRSSHSPVTAKAEKENGDGNHEEPTPGTGGNVGEVEDSTEKVDENPVKMES